MARIYISAPVTGYDYGERKKFFHDIEVSIARMGDKPVNPMRHTTEYMSHEDAMRVCLRLLLRCDEMRCYGDVANSSGCLTELDVAGACGIKVTMVSKDGLANKEQED